MEFCRLPLLLLASLLLLSLTAPAQPTPFDSLRRVAARHPADTTGSRALILLSEAYRNSQPDSAAYYARLAVRRTRQHNQPRLTPTAYNALAMARYYAGDYPAAHAGFDSAYLAARPLDNGVLMGWARNNDGNVFIEEGNYVAALDRYQEALRIRQEAGDVRGAAMSINNIGFVYKDIGDYDKALPQFFRALRTFEQLRDTASMATTYTYIGIVYVRQKNQAKGTHYLRRALAHYRQLGNAGGEAISLQMLAAVYVKAKDAAQALRYYRAALRIYEATRDVRQQALVHGDIGEVYGLLHDYRAAAAGYARSIALSRSIANGRNIGHAFVGLADAQIFNGQLPAARAALDSARRYIGRTASKEDFKQYYQVESRYHEAAGNHARALASYRQYTAYKDSLLNAENLKAMADVAVKYETEKKEQQIQLQQAQLARRNVVLWAVCGLSALLALLGWSYYRRYRYRQQARLQAAILRQQALAAEAVLEAEEKERRRIASDLHDGVGQMMSAARMNMSAIENELPFVSGAQKQAYQRVLKLVDDSCREVRVVSHSMMPNALRTAGLAAAVRESLAYIEGTGLQVSLHTAGLDTALDPQTETALYRVVQECVNNVIKHAQATELHVALVRDEDGISASIEDNGRGFDARHRPAAGIGLKNIQSRVRLLRGTVEWDSRPGAGTAVTVHIPYAAEYELAQTA